MVIELEPNEKQNDETIWYINYGKDRQGSIFTNEHEVGAPYVNFGLALMNTFTQSKDAILILDGYTMALILMPEIILVCLTLMVLLLFLNF
jgi:hypothetical protein